MKSTQMPSTKLEFWIHYYRDLLLSGKLDTQTYYLVKEKLRILVNEFYSK